MKTIYVLRHAKSSWSDAGLSDFERPLNERGSRAAPFIGGIMRARGYLPDVVISSPAERARQTAELVVNAAGYGRKVQFDENIYEASPQTLMTIIGGIDDSCSSAMIVGHNPGMEGLIRLLTGNAERMQTAALAVIDLDIDSWGDTGPGVGRLREIVRPKQAMKAAGADHS